MEKLTLVKKNNLTGVKIMTSQTTLSIITGFETKFYVAFYYAQNTDKNKFRYQ